MLRLWIILAVAVCTARVVEARGWEDVSGTTVPPPGRWGQDGDIVGDTFYLFGGVANGAQQNDLWAFNLTDSTWAHISTRNAPPRRRSHNSKLLPGTSTFIVFGGQAENSANLLNDVWMVDVRSTSPEWTQLIGNNNGGPPGRFGSGMIPDDDGFVVRGGWGNNGPLADVWRFSISTRSFVQMTAADGCVLEKASEFCYGPLNRNAMLVFAGFVGDAVGQSTSTVSWDGSNTCSCKGDVLPGSPPERSNGVMALTNSSAMVFGGKRANGQYLNDVWQLAGEGWKELSSQGSAGPTPRQHLMAVAHRECMVIVGGLMSNGALKNDVWRYCP